MPLKLPFIGLRGNGEGTAVLRHGELVGLEVGWSAIEDETAVWPSDDVLLFVGEFDAGVGEGLVGGGEDTAVKRG